MTWQWASVIIALTFSGTTVWVTRRVLLYLIFKRRDTPRGN